MAQTLGTVAVGTVVKINESGSPVNYLVVHQGLPSSMYDASCNGTWVLRQDIYETGQWNSTNVNKLSGSTIMTTMAGMLSLYDSFIQNAIQTVKIPYCVGGGSSTVNSGANGLQCQIFPLGGYEVGWTTSASSYFPVDGAVLSYFAGTASTDSKRIANFNGSPSGWWIRSKYTSSTSDVWRVYPNGSPQFWGANNFYGFRPAFVLSQDLGVSDDNTIIPPSPTSVTVPTISMVGTSIPVSWGTAPGADSYILQRKADSGEWTQVYAGTATSYTDTAGSWSTVQYQVCGVFDGTNGAFAQSDSITVIAASALVISGTDGDLGTITADIPYSVATDTGNQISLTRTVNGAQVASLTVSTGFSYNIPVMDLPTGTNTIVITATVQTSSDPVTVTRTWTYTKVAQTFPGSGGVAQLAKDGQNVFPMTLAEAVKAIGGPWGGNLSTALNKLALATVFNREVTPKYVKVNVDLSTVQAGDIVNLPENGVMVPFYVASLDYEPTLNTGGTRVLLVRKDVYQNGQWDAFNENEYTGSTIDTWFNNTYKPMLDSKVLAEIGTTTFPCTQGNGSSSLIYPQKSVFALSLTELGYSNTYANVEGSALPIANTLKIADFNGVQNSQSTRTPYTGNTSSIFTLDINGSAAPMSANGSAGYRPCFTLPVTFTATYYVDESGNVYPSQEYTTAGDFYDLWGNVIPSVKIATGSYTGTGTYGASNANSITAPFSPKIAFITPESGANDNIAGGFINFLSGYYSVFHVSGTSPAVGFGRCSVEENTAKWWATGSTGTTSNVQNVQFNVSGVTYPYIIFG